MRNWIAEHKAISIGAGIAVLTTLAQIFSNIVKQHPYLVWASAVISGAMIIVPLFSSSSGGSDVSASSHKAELANSGLVVVDQSGSIDKSNQISVSGDLNLYPVPRSPTPGHVSPPMRKNSNLVERGYKKNKSDHLPYWGVNGLREVFVIRVENYLDDEKDVFIAKGICARIHFKNKLFGNELLIPKAFWDNEYCNEIDISAGEIRSVILGGVTRDGMWVCCQNDKRFTPHFLSSQYSDDTLEPQGIPFMNSSIEAEITWFSARGGKALLREKYLIALVKPDSVTIERQS
jgi:hypothetical protein